MEIPESRPAVRAVRGRAPDTTETFGQLLRRLRGNRSLRDVAQRANCGKSYIYDLENGRRRPSTQIADALDRALGAQGRLAALANGNTAQLNEKANSACVAALEEDATSDLAAMESFRLADRQLGGGHLYNSVALYLNRHVAPRLFGIVSSGDAGQTMQAAAALTEMAGWMAHDSGRDALALQHFESALPLARTGSDAALCAHVMGSMSHLALQTGRYGHAVELAQEGRKGVASGPAAPALSARLHAMEARALARTGRNVGSRVAIEEAQRCLAQYTREMEQSPWISSFDAASLASETALCLIDLGLLEEAAVTAEHAIALRTGDRARSRVFGQIMLCMIRIRQRELEAACSVGYELLESCRTLGSMRITQQLGILGKALVSHCAERPVAEFLDSLMTVNRQRALLLAGISAPQDDG